MFKSSNLKSFLRIFLTEVTRVRRRFEATSPRSPGHNNLTSIFAEWQQYFMRVSTLVDFLFPNGI